jgi:hypothetical protein
VVTNIWADGSGVVARRSPVSLWMLMPRPKPTRYYLAHPWPQRARRGLYATWAVLMAAGYAGTSAIQGSDRFVPVLFALACAACLVGVVRVESWTNWYMSGAAVFGSYLFRLLQIFATELGWTDQTPPDSASLAASAYVACCIGSVACWKLWLHPRVERG